MKSDVLSDLTAYLVAALLVCFIKEIVILGSQICCHIDLPICHSYDPSSGLHYALHSFSRAVQLV